MSSSLTLYRSILRLHRAKLPSVKRQLGDAVVRKEFRDHVEATPEFLQGFTQRVRRSCIHYLSTTSHAHTQNRQWTAYRDALANQADASSPFGADLDAATKSSMNAEQAEQLRELKSRVVRPE